VKELTVRTIQWQLAPNARDGILDVNKPDAGAVMGSDRAKSGRLTLQRHVMVVDQTADPSVTVCG
jgi:hypothetical protein